jgi:hypothetical protein
MNGRYSIRREPDEIEVPFGATGVAALGAVFGGVIGLLVPTGLLESLSFNLYLDQITDLAKPPLGMTAKLLAAVALGALTGTIGYIGARWKNVGATPDGFSGLLDRLRGVDADDEEDAPLLRRADRHPDAPARRPFSAARDIPEREWDDWVSTGDARPAADAIDSDDELLLDMMVPVPGDSADSGLEPAAAQDILGEPVASPVVAAMAPDNIEDYDLRPPALEDWEVEPADEDMVLTAPLSVEPERTVEVAPVSRPIARRETVPLDLSAGRLDELIARLEAGLSRKAAIAAPVASGLAAEAQSARAQSEPTVETVAAPAPADDPEFPHDPALAAALATLRRMNLRTT